VYTGRGSRPLSPGERTYLAQRRRWDDVERRYSAIQSTRPQTLGYALHDSPAGLAAWVLEKWRTWADTDGDLEGRFSRDFLLTMVTLYWVTGTITSSMRDYFDNRWHGVRIGAGDFVRTPTAIASFTHQAAPEGEPPREWFERLYDVRRWTAMPRGGHFAAAEEPERLARDIAAFFGGLHP
jgi:pimeloyl-ACP methyl ester carboxylesterase